MQRFIPFLLARLKRDLETYRKIARQVGIQPQ
jgi:hypothetical protein